MLPGTSAPTRDSASGAKSRMEREIVTASAGGDEEVEGEAGEPQQQQRGVRAQEAGLDRAHGGRGGTDDARGAADEQAVDDEALERVAPEAPEPCEQPHDHRVDQLVEEPLVD